MVDVSCFLPSSKSGKPNISDDKIMSGLTDIPDCNSRPGLVIVVSQSVFLCGELELF